MNRFKKVMSRWGPSLVWMAAIYGMSALGTDEPPEPNLLTLLIKKTGHVIEYALLAALYSRALSRGAPLSLGVVAASVGLAVLYAVSDEFHQSYVPGRHGQALDVIIDLGGTLMGVYLWRRWREGRIRLPGFLVRWGLPARGSTGVVSDT